MLEARGDLASAEAHYQAALQLRPGDDVVENALGGALLAGGQVNDAIPHFKASLQARPDYFDAHYLGKDLEATATLPDESTQVLIHIKHWEINWQAVYRYEEPAPLPKGTTITMRYAYDNSDDNVANPNHPPERVKAGNRSSDEMAHLWLQVLPKNLPGSERDPRMILQEALAQHHVDKDPGDF